jgi:predicted nucleic acid-binding Zn ribbon protein
MVYATHVDGRVLHYPTWNNRGEIIPGDDIAAVTIDQDGNTFPPGSTWIKNRCNGLQPGWKLAGTIQPRTVKTKRACTVCTKRFEAKRADAEFCSDKCRARSSRWAKRNNVVTVTDREIPGP